MWKVFVNSTTFLNTPRLPNEAPEYMKSGPCLALPVISEDRDPGDTRNQRFLDLGVAPEDLRLLESYARSLHRGGYASFFRHLQEEPCVERKAKIVKGDTHAGFPRPAQFDEAERAAKFYQQLMEDAEKLMGKDSFSALVNRLDPFGHLKKTRQQTFRPKMCEVNVRFV